MFKYYINFLNKAIIAASVAVFGFFLTGSASAAVPNDPKYAEQAPIWKQVNSPEAWNFATGSKRIVVAMIDTGMDTWHEDLRDNLWVNGEEVPDNGKDDDNNGYIDDINGWNFVDGNNDVRTSVFDAADDKEAVRHGTLVGGQVGARGGNGLDGTGVNWRVSLMPLRAIRSSGKGSFRAVNAAVNYAIDNGADIINLSFIGDIPEETLRTTLRRAYESGIVIVSAAGNYDSSNGEEGDMDKKPLYPACFDKQNGDIENWLLTVGSVDESGVLSEFSNYGKCLDIMAPGEFIYNAERYAPQYGYPNNFGGPWFGTSFAAPIVAGTAALIRSVHPEWAPKKIISTLLSTTDPIDMLNPTHVGQVGRGRVNIGKAIAFSAATPVAEGKGSIFFTKKSILWKADIDNGGKSAPLRPLNGTPLSVTDFPNYNQERVAVIVKRGTNKYFLDVYESDGRFVEEKSVPAAVVFGRTIVKFTSGILTVYSTKYLKKSGKSEVAVYDTRGKKTRKFSVAGEVINSSVSDSGKINLIVRRNNKFYFQAWGVDNKMIFSRSLNGIGAVLANETANEKTALLALRNKKIYLLMMDSTNASLREVSLSGAVDAGWHIKIMTMANKTFFLPYNAGGGSFAVYDVDLRPALTVKVSK